MSQATQLSQKQGELSKRNLQNYTPYSQMADTREKTGA